MLLYRYYGLSIWFPEYVKKLEQEEYFRKTNVTANWTVSNTVFTDILDNIHFVNVTFTNTTFSDIELHHVTFDQCFLTRCLFQNVVTKKTYFLGSVIKASLFDQTDFYEFKFVDTLRLNTSVVNTTAGCQVDFDVSYSSRKVFLENFLSQLAVLPTTLLSAFLIDKAGRVRLLGEMLL